MTRKRSETGEKERERKRGRGVMMENRLTNQ